MLKLTGGAFGVGTRRNLRGGYAWLCENYEPGDLVVWAGFSRGAFTGRSEGGMINHCGIAKNPDHADDAWRAYRDGEPFNHASWSCVIHDAVAFDTVGQLGIPVNWLSRMLPWDHRFHNTQAPGIQRRGLHLVAIDEQRRPFPVTHWEGQQIDERWLVGTHPDVGGGEGGLADLALVAAVEHLQASGVRFRSTWNKGLMPGPNAEITRPGWFWELAGLEHRVIPANAKAHPSIFRRVNYPKADLFARPVEAV